MARLYLYMCVNCEIKDRILLLVLVVGWLEKRNGVVLLVLATLVLARRWKKGNGNGNGHRGFSFLWFLYCYHFPMSHTTLL